MMTRQKFLTSVTVLFVVMLFIISGAQASVIRSATSVTQNTFGNWGPEYVVENAINQTGLSAGFVSGATDWDAYFTGNPTHTLVAPYYEWWGNSNSGLTGSVTFDLGGLFTIDKLALWNEEVTGIASFDVYTSTDGVVFNLVASNLLPTNNPQGYNYLADIFNLTNSVGQYVKLDLTGAGESGYNTVSMGEIAFSTSAVPLPSAILLLGPGLVGLAWVRRKVQR
ncbi:hypothetical protein SAMN04489760_1432 [Syntrophus gentianae]|uniref:F5/8 type C domain-containing protein n=1 Tax=Syntrophus gentianae TaxID=43775 RepID=A0A1H8B0N6_9BACT|nr:hypothetical protein [Syntrophus gentianae]SEM75648.1 hypothetical protein SAMN04489760_1432 [Syntrophus gentianae]